MKWKYFDIHSHIQFPEFDEGRAEMIGKMKEEGIAAIVVGTDAETSEQAVRLAEKNENLFAAVGLHPNDIFLEEFDEHFYNDILSRDKVVAVGECGLDYFRLSGTKSILTLAEIKQKQKEIFKKHIDLAIECKKPLMVHCRPSAGTMDAYEDALGIFSMYRSQTSEDAGRLASMPRGNMHFFAGDLATAQKFFAYDFSISFTGVITFANGYDEIVVKSPADKIMAETDCPFVAPEPYRGKRNSPLYIKEIVERIAELRGEDFEKVRETLSRNAEMFIGLL